VRKGANTTPGWDLLLIKVPQQARNRMALCHQYGPHMRSIPSDRALKNRKQRLRNNGLQDQPCLEVLALEVVLGSALQLPGDRIQDYGPLREKRGKVGRHA
jgi:hypothetical protein